MKALSLWNPHALLMALNRKQIETRHWPTDYRGLLAIHAAKRWTLTERNLTYRFRCLYPCIAPQLDMLGWSQSSVEGNPYFGAVLCIVRVVDCVPTEKLITTISQRERDFGNYAPGRFGWKCELVETFVSNPYQHVTGRQGLFTWERPAS